MTDQPTDLCLAAEIIAQAIDAGAARIAAAIVEGLIGWAQAQRLRPTVHLVSPAGAVMVVSPRSLSRCPLVPGRSPTRGRHPPPTDGQCWRSFSEWPIPSRFGTKLAVDEVLAGDSITLPHEGVMNGRGRVVILGSSDSAFFAHGVPLRDRGIT